MGVFSFVRQHWLVAIFVAIDVALAVILFYSVLINVNKTATIDILVAPSNATVHIKGHTYTSGAYRVQPGEFTAKVTADGFEAKTVTVSASENAVTKIYVYLVNTEKGMDYYAENESESSVLATIIGDNKADSSYRFAIIGHLPLIYKNKTNLINDGESLTVVQKINDCQKHPCLQVYNSGMSSEKVSQKTAELIRTAGFNPDDFEITYHNGASNK